MLLHDKQPKGLNRGISLIIQMETQKENIVKLKMMDLKEEVFIEIRKEFEKQFGEEFEYWDIETIAERRKKNGN